MPSHAARFVPFAALVAVVLAGCVAAPQVTEAPTIAPSPVSTAVPEPDATEAPAPSPDPVPDLSLNSESAYRLCVEMVDEFQRSTGGQFDVEPFVEAEVVHRDDGRFWVWAEYSDPTRAPELRDSGAAHCIVGGTIDDPEWLTYGTAGRDYKDQFPPNQTPSTE